MASTSLGPSILVSYCSSTPKFHDSYLSLMLNRCRTSLRRFRVHCESTIQEKELRRCSPILERSLLSGEAALRFNGEWKAVPDIWRSSVEKYGDKVAVVDPYHDPPKFTYKQVTVKTF